MKSVHQRARLLLLFVCLSWSGAVRPADAQEPVFKVKDYVDLAAGLGGGTGTGLYVEFVENWTFYPGLPALLKETRDYAIREPEGGTRTDDELKQQLAVKIGQLPVSRGKAILGEVVYEFSLLDSHLEGSGLEGFPEPDSMDRSTRELQGSLIELVRDRLRNIDRYRLEEQLLSVRFHETWRIDPASLEIFRQVNAITPVIWQRRRTTDGEPVNEAGTGWPVYYKNILATVNLRNP